MAKHVLAAVVRQNEAEALGGVEELDAASTRMLDPLPIGVPRRQKGHTRGPAAKKWGKVKAVRPKTRPRRAGRPRLGGHQPRGMWGGTPKPTSALACGRRKKSGSKRVAARDARGQRRASRRPLLASVGRDGSMWRRTLVMALCGTRRRVRSRHAAHLWVRGCGYCCLEARASVLGDCPMLDGRKSDKMRSHVRYRRRGETAPAA
jgi:hypothetical protein